MNSEQAAAQVIEQLERLQVEYMLVGAFSSNIYGIPRSTKDADIVVAFDTMQISEFCKQLGPDFQLDRQMMIEVFTGSVRNVVRFKPTDFDIEFFRLGDDAHHQQRFQRRIRHRISDLDIEAWVPPPRTLLYKNCVGLAAKISMT